MPVKITFFSPRGEYVIAEVKLESLHCLPSVGDFATVHTLADVETVAYVTVTSREFFFNPEGTLNCVKLNCDQQ